MRLKRRVSLFLAVAMALSAMVSNGLSANAKGIASLEAMSETSMTPEGPEITPQEPDLTPGEPDADSDASLLDLKLSYQEEKDMISLSFQASGHAYVKIYANGRVLEEEYTGTVYDCTDIEEGKDYLFLVMPYDKENRAGTGKQISFSVPYKKAVLEDIDVDYNLEKQVLIVDWTGSGIAYADVYQDDILIGKKIRNERLILEISLEAKSKHTYKVIPYNKIDEAGAEKTYLLEVDDYVARIDQSQIEYVEALRQIQMSWEDSYTKYVEISLNDEVLEEKYTGKSYVINCELQPGASYVVSILPYNEKEEAGEEEEDDVSFGYFDIPDDFKASLVNVPVKSGTGGYTGFSSPSVQLTWQAQNRAVYEIYRAEGKDARGAYQWIANVKAGADGLYTYTDEKAGFSSYYYKVRRKIVTDSYVEQELYTALSDAKRVNVTVPKPTVKAQLEGNGKMALSISSRREYVSGYDIYRKCGRGSYKFLTTITGDAYVDKSIEFGKNYHYKAKAYYYDVRSGKKTYGKYSKAAGAKNTVSAIQAEAVAISADTVKLAWTPAANASEYEIYYKSGLQGDAYALWTKTDRLSVTRKLKSGGTYYFMVKACQETDGGKAYFSSAEAVVKMGFSAPGGLNVSKTAYDLNKKTDTLIQKDTLSWNRVYGASGYRVEVYDETTKKYRRVATVKSGSKTSYTVSNVVAPGAKQLKYRISAYAKEKVKKGDTITITPTLGTVQNVTVKKSGSKVKISWNKVRGAERYQVYRSNGRTMLLVAETAFLSTADQGLCADVPYTYYVQAVNNTKKISGEKSEPAEFRIRLGEVSNLKAVNTSAKTVKLSWKDNKEAQSYDIYYKDSESKKYQKIDRVAAKKGVYVHTGRTAGTTCYYKVVAVQINSAGVRAESEGALASVKVSK